MAGVKQKEIGGLIARYRQLKSDRAIWESLWQEICDYVVPQKSLLGHKTQMGGQQNTSLICDSTAIDANEKLANSICGMLKNPATPWLAMQMAKYSLNDVHEVRTWTQEAVEVVRQDVLNSNFHTHDHEFTLDQTSVGTGIMFIEPGEGDDGVAFTARHVFECVLAENANGEIDTVFRSFKLTARQAKQKFGSGISPEVAKQLKEPDQADVAREYLHVTMPRADRNPGGKINTKLNMPFASIYIDMEAERCVQEGGFEEWPWVTARWFKLSGEIYGRSPAMKALPDIREINKRARSVTRGGELKVDPSLLMPDEGVRLPLRKRPNAINYYSLSKFRDRNQNIVQALPTGEPGFGVDLIQMQQQAIRTAFMVDELDLKNSPQMTAYEASIRDARQARVLAPILGRQNPEFLQKFFDRVFGILWRQGKIPPPPQVLSGQQWVVEFTSPLAKQQKRIEAEGMQHAFAFVGPLAQLDPNIMDNFDLDKVARTTPDMYSMPADTLRSDDEVEQMRQARAERMRQQQQAQQIMQGAEMAKGAAEAGQAMSAAQMASKAAQDQAGGVE